MAIKAELKGYLQSVGEAVNVGKESTLLKQEIVIMIPGYRDEFGEKKGKDEHWCISILGEDKIKALNLSKEMVRSKVVATVYINSREFTNQNNEVFYNLNVNLSALEFKSTAGAPATPEAGAASPAGNDDDLPF